MATLQDYVLQEEKIRRIHLQFPATLKDFVLELLYEQHPNYRMKMAGPVVDRRTMLADPAMREMVVEVPE